MNDLDNCVNDIIERVRKVTLGVKLHVREQLDKRALIENAGEINKVLFRLMHIYSMLTRLIQSKRNVISENVYLSFREAGKEITDLTNSMVERLEKEMEVKQMTGDKPKYKGDGIAAWENTDKNGNSYLTVKILGAIRVNMFPVEEESLE